MKSISHPLKNIRTQATYARPGLEKLIELHAELDSLLLESQQIDGLIDDAELRLKELRKRRDELRGSADYIGGCGLVRQKLDEIQEYRRASGHI